MRNKIQIFLIIAISVLVGYFAGINQVKFEWANYKPHLNLINKEPPASASNVDFTQFWAVWDRISTMYYDKKVVDPQKMLQGAITGMVQSLNDPYTMYLPPVQNTNFQQQLAGQFQGIGAELGMKDKQTIVVAPLNGSPAQKAGLKAGDVILKVDNTSIAGWTLQQTVTKIRGKKGTKVVLNVIHKDDQNPVDISITRDTITVKSVDGWIKDIKDVDNLSDSYKTGRAGQKVMYVRLSEFGDATNQDWTALISSLVPQVNSSGVKGMILDLRDNPGGYLTDAVFIAGEFLPINAPVVSEDPGNGDITNLSVNRNGTLLNIPLVVLINGGSASASEIVSGALRDNHRAKLVGDKSFGKGTVQQALDLGQGAGLHVTIAKWLTPNGTWVHGKGLTPEVSVALDPKDPTHDTQLEKAIDTVLQ